VERGRFEPPRLFRIRGAEFGPSLAAQFGPKKSIGAGENLFVWDSALLRISPVPFRAQGLCAEFGDVEHQTKVWSSKSPPARGMNRSWSYFRPNPATGISRTDCSFAEVPDTLKGDGKESGSGQCSRRCT
jgi:hypothetical protein